MKQLKTLTFTALVAATLGLQQTVSANQIKTMDAAKSIVLKDLSLNASQVRFKDLDFEKGIYEIDLVANNVEYDYDVQASTGKIIKKKSKTLTPTKTTVKPAQPAQPTQAKKTTVAVTISMEQAKTIALKDAGLTANKVRFKEVDLEKSVYEVDFVANNLEYEYDINGLTGKIIKKKTKAVAVKPATPQKKPVVVTQPKKVAVVPTLSVEQVKTIVLKDLGLAAAKVRFKEIDLEKGIYEVEALANNSEFDYKINGTTGQIIKKKVEVKKSW
ncbi:PepSY domain-containing protein [Streptococcus suis]|uniref:PepSY domain-containing protein n=1 Tax=Streptococcus suis TaxID=1307 RepID=UPI00137B2271|nr:PepSY domain-containing protein [Streptococcus suis]